MNIFCRYVSIAVFFHVLCDATLAAEMDATRYPIVGDWQLQEYLGPKLDRYMSFNLSFSNQGTFTLDFEDDEGNRAATGTYGYKPTEISLMHNDGTDHYRIDYKDDRLRIFLALHETLVLQRKPRENAESPIATMPNSNDSEVVAVVWYAPWTFAQMAPSLYHEISEEVVVTQPGEFVAPGSMWPIDRRSVAFITINENGKGKLQLYDLAGQKLTWQKDWSKLELWSQESDPLQALLAPFGITMKEEQEYLCITFQNSSYRPELESVFYCLTDGRTEPLDWLDTSRYVSQVLGSWGKQLVVVSNPIADSTGISSSSSSDPTSGGWIIHCLTHDLREAGVFDETTLGRDSGTYIPLLVTSEGMAILAAADDKGFTTSLLAYDLGKKGAMWSYSPKGTCLDVSLEADRLILKTGEILTASQPVFTALPQVKEITIIDSASGKLILTHAAEILNHPELPSMELAYAYSNNDLCLYNVRLVKQGMQGVICFDASLRYIRWLAVADSFRPEYLDYDGDKEMFTFRVGFSSGIQVDAKTGTQRSAFAIAHNLKNSDAVPIIRPIGEYWLIGDRIGKSTNSVEH